MSTSCYVGVVQSSGMVKSIRVNWDGYPSYMVPVLRSLIESGEITKVPSYGDASSLEGTIAASTFYARDRFESIDDNECELWDDADEFTINAGARESYAYIVRDGRIFLQGEDITDETFE